MSDLLENNILICSCIRAIQINILYKISSRQQMLISCCMLLSSQLIITHLILHKSNYLSLCYPYLLESFTVCQQSSHSCLFILGEASEKVKWNKRELIFYAVKEHPLGHCGKQQCNKNILALISWHYDLLFCVHWLEPCVFVCLTNKKQTNRVCLHVYLAPWELKQ